MYRLTHPKLRINKKLISNKGQTNLPSMIQIKVNQSLSVTNQIGLCSGAGEWKWKTQKFQRTQRLDHHGKSLIDTGVSWMRPDSNTNPHCSCVFLRGTWEDWERGWGFGRKVQFVKKGSSVRIVQNKEIIHIGLNRFILSDKLLLEQKLWN